MSSLDRVAAVVSRSINLISSSFTGVGWTIGTVDVAAEQFAAVGGEGPASEAIHMKDTLEKVQQGLSLAKSQLEDVQR